MGLLYDKTWLPSIAKWHRPYGWSCRGMALRFFREPEQVVLEYNIAHKMSAYGIVVGKTFCDELNRFTEKRIDEPR